MSKLKKPQVMEEGFEKTIKEAIAENRHVYYLKETLESYKKYKEFFNKEVFVDVVPNFMIYDLTIEFVSNRKVSRNIRIAGNQTLEDLALTIIKSMNWDNDHMHGFAFLENEEGFLDYHDFMVFAEGWEDDPYPTFKSWQLPLALIDYEKFPIMQFIFDFGDGHLFKIRKVDARKAKTDENKKTLPKVFGEIGQAPKQYPKYY